MASENDVGVSPTEVAGREFASARRGYDRDEVRDYLRRIARRVEQLEEALVAAAASSGRGDDRPLEFLEEVELAQLVGDETARVLVAARTAAADRKARADQESEALLVSSRSRVAQRLAEADALVAQRLGEAEEAAHARVVEAEARAASVDNAVERELDLARVEGARLVEEARVVRHRILEDLARRRNAMRRQIEQLRAGRERLLDAYEHVQRTVDDATQGLNHSLDDARLAAEHAGHRFAEGPMTVPDLEEEIAAARIIGHPMVDISTAGPTTGEVNAVLVESESTATLALVEPSEPSEPSERSEPVEPTATVELVTLEDLERAEVGGGPGHEARGPAELPAGAPEPDELDESDEHGEHDAPGDRAAVDELFDAIRTTRAARVAGALAVIDGTALTQRRQDDERREARLGVVPEPHTPHAPASEEPSSDTSIPVEPERSIAGTADDIAGLRRELKRTMTEEQNLALDLIRRRKGCVELDELYGDASAHQRRIADAISRFAEPERVQSIAGAVVELLRRRVGACLLDDEADVTRMLDRVRAIYRDIRSNRVADLVDHAA